MARIRDKYVDAQETKGRDRDEFCYDNQPNCNTTDFFCGTRPREMSQSCKLTCKMCSPGDPFKQMDLSSKCAAELERHGQSYCLEKGWTASCPHSCRDFSCKDWIPADCQSWASAGDCLSNHQYMTKICKLSCAMCIPDDPIMDTSSVCKPQEKRCRDPEWQHICPHTCRQYILRQPGSVVLPSQPNQRQPMPPLPAQPNVAAQPVQTVAPPLVPSQTQQPVGAPLQPNGMIPAVQTPQLGGSVQAQQPQIPSGGALPGRVPTQTVLPQQPSGVAVQHLGTGGPVQTPPPLQPNGVATLQPTQTNSQPLPQTQVRPQLQAQSLHQAAVAPPGQVPQPPTQLVQPTQPQINPAVQPTQLQFGIRPSVPQVQKQTQQLYPTSPVGKPMPIQGPNQPQVYSPASTYGVAGSMKKHDHQKAKNSEKISKTDTNAMESRKAKTSNRTANTGTSKEANARASDRKAEKNGDAKRNEALNKRKRKGIL